MRMTSSPPIFAGKGSSEKERLVRSLVEQVLTNVGRGGNRPDRARKAFAGLAYSTLLRDERDPFERPSWVLRSHIHKIEIERYYTPMMKIDVLRDALRDLSLMFGGGERQSEATDSDFDRLAFGTVVREAPIGEAGELVVLDWTRKEVEAKVPIRPCNPTIEEDPNPRGNARGCKGIRWWNEQLIAASYHTLELYDETLTQTGALSDGLMVGLHEIDVTERNTVWVSSTAIDAAVEYDLSDGTRGRVFWPREMPTLQDELGLEPLTIDKEADNRLRFLEPSATNDESHLHLNAVEEYEGRVYALFNSYDVVVDLTNEEIVLQDERLSGAHNLTITEEGIAIVNDTWGTTVRFYDLNQGALRRSIDLTKYRWVRRLIRWEIPAYWGKELARKIGLKEHSVAKPLFVRGLVRRGDTLFVGVSPAAILQIDWTSGELLDAYQYSSDVHVCIHGLEVME